MKKRFTKLVSFLLIAVMVMGMGISTPVLAADTTANKVMRGPAAPISSVTLGDYTWDEDKHIFEFSINVRGFGWGTVKFDNISITNYGRSEIKQYGQIVGWQYHYRTPRIYHPGTYKMEALFTSHNVAVQWPLTRYFTVTEKMLK